MKQAMINYIKNPKNDELYTPEYAVYPLLPYLEKFKNKIFWECTDFGESNITKVLKDNGFSVVTSHINKNQNFFEYQPNNWDVLITNPPYSLKDEFLEKAYELGKPFCMLLPLTALEGVKRGDLFKKYGIEVLILDKRVNFMKEKKSCWFNTSWFCWDVLPKQLIFEKIIKR